MEFEKTVSGVHPATITMEYQDNDGNAYTVTDTLGVVDGKVTLSYEDDFGKTYTKNCRFLQL